MRSEVLPAPRSRRIRTNGAPRQVPQLGSRGLFARADLQLLPKPPRTLIPARRPRRGLRSGFLATSYSGANLIVPGRVDVLFRGSRRDCHTSRGRHGLPVKIGRTKGVFALGAYQPSACRVYRALHNKDQKTLDSRSSLRAILILALQNHSWAPRLVMSAAHPERRRSCQ